MRMRVIAVSGSFVIAAAVVGLNARALGAQAASSQAQAPRPAPKPATMPRTADGHPDLQGVYDVATMTPVERLPGVKSLVLTKEEAGAMEAYEAQRQVKNDAPLAGDRSAPPVGGETTTGKSYLEFLERAGGGVVGGYNNFWLAGGTKLLTIDGQKRSSIVVDPPDGRIPRQKPEAIRRNQLYLANAASPDASEGSSAGPAGAFDGPEGRPLAERCLLGFLSTAGPPSLPNYFYNNLKQIVQTRDSVLIFNEMVHDARVVRMNAEHLPKQIRKWMGDSVGRWDGDTLVIDTTNFTDKTKFQGSSDQLHVVERITRVDPNTLLYRFTVDDPQTWEGSWTGEYPWVASTERIFEYACHEGNYALENMLRGARAKEAEEAAKKKQ
jgi:hypothetical protein